MKICNTCKLEKPFDQFYKRKDAYRDPYRSDCKACLASKSAKRYEADPEKFSLWGKQWREKNPDKEKDRGKKYRELNKEAWSQKTLNWQKRNKDKVKLIKRAYAKRHPDRMNARTVLRKTRLMMALPEWLSPEQAQQIQAFYRHATALSKQTGIQHHVDHIVPLGGRGVCGLHVPWNLQVITANENHKKHNKHDQ